MLWTRSERLFLSSCRHLYTLVIIVVKTFILMLVQNWGWVKCIPWINSESAESTVCGQNKKISNKIRAYNKKWMCTTYLKMFIQRFQGFHLSNISIEYKLFWTQNFRRTKVSSLLFISARDQRSTNVPIMYFQMSTKVNVCNNDNELYMVVLIGHYCLRNTIEVANQSWILIILLQTKLCLPWDENKFKKSKVFS